VGDVEQWLKAQGRRARRGPSGAAADSPAAVRDDLARINRRRELARAAYEQALEERDPNARIALEVVAKLDTERDTLTAGIADAVALAAEWEDAGDSGLAESVDLVRALTHADTAEALNRAMAKAVAGIHIGIRDGRLRAEFTLKHPEGVPYLFRHADPVDLAAKRMTLPDAPSRTVRFTKGQTLRRRRRLSTDGQARSCVGRLLRLGAEQRCSG
jgi:hypothetical protein